MPTTAHPTSTFRAPILLKHCAPPGSRGTPTDNEPGTADRKNVRNVVLTL